ncbi:MAG: hypothetical protein HDR50_05360 [Desulfovibrio sp.]|uniref:VgrG-related protein n=1 Tax=Desulfovibrio sp. TaxID=885 RepID=UPI001A65AFF6|nr:hypothetical protein [Desulfovibrio sp.]MBD5417081.1 hypothetical protein [Desulfovibrio sp.]
MAIRIQHYSTPPRNIHAGGIDAGFAQPLIRDAGRSTDADIINEMAKAGMQITEVGFREYVKDQSTAVAQALNDYRRQLSEERERYTTENKGKDAVNAGEHFDAFAREAAQPLADQFSGRAREMFLRDAAATGLHFTEQGQAYGRREKEVWQKSVFEGDMSETLNAIANDPGNAEFVQHSLAGLKQRMADMTPGLDHRAMEADLNRKVAGVTIDALLARKNVAGAQIALDQASGYGGVGSLAAVHESAMDPGAISRDTGGSKSYGLFQFNNRGGKGTANSFMESLKTTHPKLHEALGGGKYAVGSEEFDNAFRQAANGPLRAEMVQAQREHLTSQYLRPIEQRLKGSELFAAFGDNAAMREVMLSTAIQHGPAGAKRILREAWGMVDKGADKQAQLEQFITATYELRGRPGEFRTALAEQKDEAGRQRLLSSQRGRYAKEKEQALALARSGPEAMLPPAELMQLQGKIDHARREQAQEAGLTTQAFGNHLEYGLEKGDFTAAEKDVTALRSLGFALEAAELSGRLELARTAHSALNDVNDLPLAEQGAAVHAQLDSMVTPDNAKSATAMRDNVVRVLAQKQAAFIKDPAASVSALPAMQGEMPPQERVRRSLELQERIGAGLAFEPRVLPVEQARQLKAAYDKLDAPVSRVAWLGELSKTYGPYARQALHEMQVPEQVVTLLPVLGVMNEKSMGLALTALEVKDGDIPGLDKDAKQAAVDAAAENRLLKDVLTLSRAFPANEAMRRFGQGMETMLTNYVKLGGNLEDFNKAFESAANGECFLMLPRNAAYDVDDVLDATRDVREDLREKLLAGVPEDTQQGCLDRANLSGLIERGVFVSDETGTRVTLIDPQHGRPVVYGDGTPLSFEIATIVKEGAERKARLQQVAESFDDDMAGLEAEL